MNWESIEIREREPRVVPHVMHVNGVLLSPAETALYKKLQELEKLILKITKE